MNNKEGFRSDIQGLRAIAVLSVVVFHISPKHLQGGFLGVDVFFVISGFLIIGFIHRDLVSGCFSLNEFYFKRVRRLLPAFLFVVLCSSALAYLLFVPQEFSKYMRSMLASITYVSNFYFYTEAGYFDFSLELSPLLHTWSLSVEEQFYIIIPAVLLLLFKSNSKTVVVWLFVFSFLSLAFSEIFTYLDRDFSFYSSPSRFWQFILGGILAVKLSSLKIKGLYYDLIGFSGIFLLVPCFFIYSGDTVLPGVNALLPTVATAMIIFSGFNRNAVLYKILSNKVGMFVGNISYSLYLWHWPVIIFYKLSISHHLGNTDKAIVLFLSIILGYLSWLFIEKNGRILISKTRSYSLAVLSIIFVCAGSFFLQHLNGLRFTEDQLNYASYLDYKANEYRIGVCFLAATHNNFELYDQDACVAHEEGSENYILIGDSHAAHWFGAIHSTRPPNVTVTQVTASGCYPTLPLTGSKNCTDLLRWAFEDLLPNKKYDKIILSSRWKSDSAFKIKDTVDRLRLYTDDIVVLGPTVEYDSPLPRVLALSKDEKEISRHRSYDKAERIDFIMEREISNLDNVRYVSIFKAICPDQNMCVTSTDEGAPIAFDTSHFTISGARHVLDQVGL